jgi:TPR repeat protein
MKPLIPLLALLLALTPLSVVVAQAPPNEAERKVFLDFKARAEKGDAGAQVTLGRFYSMGQGVEKDDAAAVPWYRKAAEQNHPGAQFWLGSVYFNGRGVPKDMVEGAKWWLKAAEQNDTGGQYNIGMAYANGLGVPKDLVKSHAWCTVSAANNKPTTAILAKIEKQMTPEQLAEAARLAREITERLAKLKKN